MRQAYGEVGFALQSGVGVPASNPAYVLGVLDGFPEPMQDIQVVAPAAHRLVTQEVRKGMGRWEAGTTVWGHPASLGTLLKAILPTENVSGGGPYDHVFTPAATDQYLTMFSARPGPLYERYDDGLIESLVLDWMSGRRLAVTVQASGLTPRIISAYTPGLRESEGPNEDVFTFLGATMKLDYDATPAVTTVTNIEDGAIRLTRPLAYVPTADALTAMTMTRGPLNLEAKLSLIFEDYDGYRATFFGSTAGSTPSGTVVYGSLDFTFVGGTDRALQIEVPRVALRWEAPQPSPRPGALMVDVSAQGARPTSGAFSTATLTNAVSGAY